jgi:glycosyltransferase involved in cell wall biosynthesis
MNEEIHFIIIGAGPEKQDLINFVEKNKLSNVSFLGYLEISIVNKLIECFDVCFLGYRKAGWLKYGISSNKIFDYMHSAKPIIAAMDTKYDLISKGKCGITVPSEDPYEIQKAIETMYKLPKNKRNELGQNGKKYLLKHHTYEQIAEKYSRLFSELSK